MVLTLWPKPSGVHHFGTPIHCVATAFVPISGLWETSPAALSDSPTTVARTLQKCRLATTSVAAQHD
jgi:hypothetical protein